MPLDAPTFAAMARSGRGRSPDEGSPAYALADDASDREGAAVIAASLRSGDPVVQGHALQALVLRGFERGATGKALSAFVLADEERLMYRHSGRPLGALATEVVFRLGEDLITPPALARLRELAPALGTADSWALRAQRS